MWSGVLAMLLAAPVASAEWQVFQRPFPMDDIVFHLATGFALADGDDIRALMIGCATSDRHVVDPSEIVEIDLDLFGAEGGGRPITIPGGADSRHEFRVRWDDEPPIALPFHIGRDGESLFFPEDRIELNGDFVNRVMVHDRLLLEVTSVGVLEFPLDGATKAIMEIRRLCSQ